MLGQKNMDDFKKQLPEIKKKLESSKYSINKNILSLQETLGNLYQINSKKINNKLIFIKRGVDKVNSAQKYLANLSLSFSSDQKDTPDIKSALNEAVRSLAKLESLLEDRERELKRSAINSKDIINFRRDMDSLKQAHNCLRTLDTDMHLEEKDFEKNERSKHE